jgi:hypothetical protein
MEKGLKDFLAGLIFIGLGAAFAIGALGYPLGSALRMGPGYIPVALGGVLVLLGLLVVVEGFYAEGSELGPTPWRAIVLILAAIFFFGLMVRRLGLAPTLFIASFIASFSSREMRLVPALVIALALTVFCILIFVKALGLPVPLFGPWLGA